MDLIVETMEKTEGFIVPVNTKWLLDLTISLTHMITIFFVCYILRIACKKLLPKSSYPYVAEIICMFQLSVCSMENGTIIYPEYGVVVYAVIMFLLSAGYFIVFDANGNPCGVLTELVQRRITPSNALSACIKTVCTVVGGLVAIQHVNAFWSFGALTRHYDHVQHLHIPCASAMKTTAVYGFVAEFLATFTVRFVAGLQLGGRRWHMYVFAAVIVAVTLTGAEYTGMMFNPALATVLTYNCAGHSFAEHATIYWVSPMLATLVAIYTVSSVKHWQKKQSIAKKAQQSQMNGEVKSQTNEPLKQRKTRKRKRYY
ncbi:aquaporin-11-like [Ptychodera flava]|uniref:aquaporin-11-like n=1 Tax=Ptychodera flava TaxID=63121 RepID=UPI003969CCCE